VLMLCRDATSCLCSNRFKHEQNSCHRKTVQFCSKHCMSEWSSWTDCTAPCGGGTTNRDREEDAECKRLNDPKILGDKVTFNCGQSKSETKPCNQGCTYGLPAGGSCRCPKGRTGRCCAEVLKCEYPGRPDNGVVTNVWSRTSADIGTVANYTCLTGYYLIGEYHIMCEDFGNARGEWTSAMPRCQRIECLKPDVDPHSNLLNERDEYVAGENAWYNCYEGYELVGPNVRTCQSSPGGRGQWTGFAPICEPVSCPDPGVPIYGSRVGTDVTFESVVRFGCDDGYRLVGSTELRCLASAMWFGNVPTCEHIVCDSPFVPDNGAVRIRQGHPHQEAVFRCNDGYVLEGEATLQCEANGLWSDIEPLCNAIDCGDPGQPHNGHKDGTIYTYPWLVNFICYRGYVLNGFNSSVCQQSGSWSNSIPNCPACPLNTYDNEGKICTPCPANSHTLTVASTVREQCICDYGYVTFEDQCLELTCIDLTPPEYGIMQACRYSIGESCNFTCIDGYVARGQGSTILTCLDNGVWSAEPITCAPCDMNTYKTSERMCSSCPSNSATNNSGQMKEGCICKIGYQGPPGGPCIDVDECALNNGRGPCEDTCSNFDGDYLCHCTTPGYTTDPANDDRCYPEYQCKNITSDEAPQHGGAVCHWYNEQNSQFCEARCDPGYEHPDKTNNYETCGPVTNYEWSFRIGSGNEVSKMPDCIEAFFPGIQLDADMKYFTSKCTELNDVEKQLVKEQFTQILNDNNVCTARGTQLCEIKDTSIICGNSYRRRRRDASGPDTVVDETEVIVHLNISSIEHIKSKEDCNATVCEFLGLSLGYVCDTYCIKTYSRFLRAGVMYAERQLKRLYNNPADLQNLVIEAADRVFHPRETNNIHTSGIWEKCSYGMEYLEDSCRPCRAGTYLDISNRTCISCPIGSHQENERQDDCNICTPGTTSYTEGARVCELCSPGSWGVRCEGSCMCENGFCNPVDGTCICDSGYEGLECDIDIPGCRDGMCFPGVECFDASAPSTGFTCGSCPVGYSGDGYNCVNAGIYLGITGSQIHAEL